MTAAPPAGPPHPHVCAVAHGDQGRARLAANWAGEGLAAGERVVWIEPSGGALFNWLDAQGVAWHEALDAGALRIVDPRDIVQLTSADDVPLRIEGAAALARQAVADGYTGLRVGVETAVALDVMPDVDTQLVLEAAWEQATLTEPLSLLCLYDPTVYGPQLFDAIRLHPRAFADDLAQVSASADSTAAAGEVDLSNAAMVRAFLEAGPTEGASTLDLSACRFVDLTGASELVAFARSRAPHRLRVLHPPHSLTRVLQLTDRAHEVDLVEAAP